MSNEIIEAELEDAYEAIDKLTEKPGEFSEITDMTENIHHQTKNLVRDQKLPEKEVIAEISTTDMVIDLSLANIAKTTAMKLTKMETFLGKIEDKLYDDQILDKMNKHELMALYTNTRLMRTDAYKMLVEIRKNTDFSTLEAQLLSLHSKESMREDDSSNGGQMRSVIEQIMLDPDFLARAAAKQKENLNKEQE